jgi:hypothetical protein
MREVKSVREGCASLLISIAEGNQLYDRIASAGLEILMKTAKEAGFLNWEESESVIREMGGSSEEVSDAVLGLVAGGLTRGEVEAWVGEKPR